MSRHQKAGRKGGAAAHARRTHWTAGKPRHPDVDSERVVAMIRDVQELRKVAELCRRLRINRRTPYRWLSGDRPSPTTFRRLTAEHLRITKSSC